MRFWAKSDLGPERLLINPFAYVGGIKIVQKSDTCDKMDADAMSLLLCQDHLFLYDVTIQRLLNHTDHHSAWKVWIKRHIKFLLKENSQVTLAFKSIFNIKGSIFAPGGEGFTRD